jgi:hypothetical protein
LKVINIVENQSTQVFNEKEMNFLNKGLKFSLPHVGSEVEQLVAGIEASIIRLNEPTKNHVREACPQVISKNLRKTSHSQSENHNKVIKSLRRKDCFYLKADKGNKVLILDKEDYYERVNHLISNGPYQVINKNPLPGMIRDINDVLKTCSHLVTPGIRYKLYVSNPTVPKLYYLPKIHKPGKSERPIVSAINAPISKISKWLTNEFNNLPIKQSSFSVQNSLDFINRIKDIKLKDSEILVSFDHI